MFTINKGEKIKDAFIKKHLYLQTPCGGKRHCGKCKFKVIQGNLPLSEEEKQLLNNNEHANVRLLCFHDVADEDIVVEACRLQTFQISGNQRQSFSSKKEKGYAIAIDIGTTTVVCNILDLWTGSVLFEKRFLNPQSICGSDVISRINNLSVMNLKKQQALIVDAIKEEMNTQDLSKVKRMVVCGNPTMTHIFMGIDPTSIATAPYTCEENQYRTFDGKTIFGSSYDFLVQVLPPLSAFVGADVLMGIYYLKLHHQQKPTFFIDLGTNGEMVFCINNQLFVTSAAAGPALEGGNMECGIGAISGAIYQFEYTNTWSIKTIHNQSSIGICGSGYLSFVAKALEHGFMDENGFLQHKVIFDKQQNIYVCQKDIREFQVAKSAIASAASCLLKDKDVSQVYLAGGLGENLDLSAFYALGFLPKKLQDKTNIVGNSAILGACQFAIQQDFETIMHIVEITSEVKLTQNKEFTTAFMEHMYLKEFL